VEEELPIPPLERENNMNGILRILLLHFPPPKNSQPPRKNLSRVGTRTQGAASRSTRVNVIRQPGQLESIHPPSRAHLRLVRDIHRCRRPSALGVRSNVERRLRRAPCAAAARIVRSAPRPHRVE
jgi:hypothetical protein